MIWGSSFLSLSLRIINSTGDTQTQFCLCGSLGPGAYKICLGPLSVSGRYGVDSKHDFTPPTVLLGLLFCPCMWGISSKSFQCHTAADPARLLLVLSYCGHFPPLPTPSFLSPSLFLFVAFLLVFLPYSLSVSASLFLLVMNAKENYSLFILLLLPAAFRQSSPVPAPTNLPSDGMDQGLPLNPGPRGASGGSGGVRAARGRRQRHCGRPRAGDEQ